MDIALHSDKLFGGTTPGVVVASQPLNACNDLTNPDDIKGKIVFVMRGACTFMDKIVRVEEAGGIGVIMGNTPNDRDEVFVMSGDLSGRTVKIPAMMITHLDAEVLVAMLEENQEHQHKLARPFLIAELNAKLMPLAPFSEKTLALRKDETKHTTSSVNAKKKDGKAVGNLKVEGGLTNFVVQSIDGWIVDVEEQDGSFILRLY